MKKKNETISQVFEQGKNLELSLSERERMDSFFEGYRELHPIQTEEAEKETPVPFYVFRRHAFAFASVVLFFVFGSAAFASGNALPGEPLYALKTNVVEKVRANLARTEVGRARFEITRIEERLSEARELASVGEFSAEAGGILLQKMNAHTDDFNESLTELVENGKTEKAFSLKQQYNSTARIYRTVLASFGERTHVAALVEELDPEGTSMLLSFENIDVTGTDNTFTQSDTNEILSPAENEEAEGGNTQTENQEDSKESAESEETLENSEENTETMILMHEEDSPEDQENQASRTALSLEALEGLLQETLLDAREEVDRARGLSEETKAEIEAYIEKIEEKGASLADRAALTMLLNRVHDAIAIIHASRDIESDALLEELISSLRIGDVYIKEETEVESEPESGSTDEELPESEGESEGEQNENTETTEGESENTGGETESIDGETEPASDPTGEGTDELIDIETNVETEIFPSE